MALSDDINDLQTLTPAHFLIGRASFLAPETDRSQEKIPVGKRYQLQTQMVPHIWNRWIREYLVTLQQRNKSQEPQKPLEVGDLVIVMDEVSSPHRVVTIKTATTTLKRPVMKLIYLTLPE